MDTAIIGFVGIVVGTILTSIFNLIKLYFEDNLAWRNSIRDHIRDTTILKGLIPVLNSIESIYDILYSENLASYKEIKIPKSLYVRFDNRFSTKWIQSIEFIHKKLQSASKRNVEAPEQVKIVLDNLYEEVYYFYKLQINNPHLGWVKLNVFKQIGNIWFRKKRKTTVSILQNEDGE